MFGRPDWIQTAIRCSESSSVASCWCRRFEILKQVLLQAEIAECKYYPQWRNNSENL